MIVLESCYSFKEKCIGIYESTRAPSKEIEVKELEADENIFTDEMIIYEAEYIDDGPLNTTTKTELNEQLEEEFYTCVKESTTPQPQFDLELIDCTKTFKTKRSTYNNEVKLEAIKFAEKSSNRQAAKNLSIDESCIRKWRNQKNSLQDNVQIDEKYDTLSELEGTVTVDVGEQMETEVAGEEFVKTEKNRRKSYSSSKKLKVVSYAEMTGNRQAAKVYSIDESCIRKWRLNKELLIEIDKERGTKRKPNLHWPKLDAELKAWVTEHMNNSGTLLKPSEIKSKSIELAKNLELSDFRGTSSYIFKFMERYKILGRQPKISTRKNK